MSHDVVFATGGNLKLSKLVPAHRLSVEFNWCDRSFSVMSPDWRRVRAKVGKDKDSCRWCRNEFADGDAIGLAQPKTGGANWLLCASCIEQIFGSAVSAGERHGA